MELKKTYQKARASKPIVTIFFCSLLLLSVGGVWALTTITDTGIVTPTGDYDNITISEGGQLVFNVNNTGLVGDAQSIRFNALTNKTKSFLLWKNDKGEDTGWFGCHDLANNGDIHKHCSWESNDSDIGFLESKLVMSYGTTRAESFVEVVNVANFRIGSGVNLKLVGADIIKEGNFLNLYAQNQQTYGLRIQNISDRVTLIGTTSDKIQFDSELISSEGIDISGGDLIIGNSTSGEDKRILIRTDTNNNPELWMMEGSGDSIGFKIIYESSENDFKILSRNSNVDTLRLSIDRDKGDLVIGNGTNQQNITMTSPDGTEFTCGVANGGALTCT